MEPGAGGEPVSRRQGLFLNEQIERLQRDDEGRTAQEATEVLWVLYGPLHDPAFLRQFLWPGL